MKTTRPISLRLINSRDRDESLTVCYTNWGEPYAEGIIFELSNGNYRDNVSVSLNLSEAEELAEFLPKLLAQIKGK